MENTNLKDEGMSIKGLIGFFFIFILVSAFLPGIAMLIFENVSGRAEKLAVCIADIITYLILTNKLYKKYDLDFILLSALFFGVMHMNAIQTPDAFIIGLVFGAIYLRTNSLIPGIFLHFINNTFCHVADYFPIYDDKSFSYIKLASGIVILIIFGYIYFKEKKSRVPSINF